MIYFSPFDTIFTHEHVGMLFLKYRYNARFAMLWLAVYSEGGGGQGCGLVEAISQCLEPGIS